MVLRLLGCAAGLLAVVFAGPVNAQTLPYQDDIAAIIQPLEYSGFPVLVKPAVNLSLDFQSGTWTLHNIHEYDAKGDLLLEQGRYGLCAELSAYVYARLKPRLSPQYTLKFAMATEAGFFPTYESNHMVLLLFDRDQKRVYLIDPSFHRYESVKDASGYEILNIRDTLAFLKAKSHDTSFHIDQAMPLFIKDDLLLSFSVTSVDGKFDKDNFLFVVSATRKYRFSGLNIAVVGRYHGKIESFQSTALLQQLLAPKEISVLYQRLKIWLQQIP